MRFHLSFVFCQSFFLSISATSAASDVAPASYLMPATFSLDDRSLTTKSSFAVLTDEFFSGKTLALKILYSPKQITEEAITDILKNGGRSFTNNTEIAYLVLFLDKSNHVWQVNLTVVLKGQTVGYTIASTSEELKKFTSTFDFDGTRLKLQSRGVFQDTGSDKVTSIKWDVNDNLPVYKVMSRPEM